MYHLQAFPYFYVPYHDDLPQEPEAASAYVRRLALALNAALNMTGASKAGVGGPGDPVQGANDETPAPGAARATSRQRVFGAALVRGTAFYGYAPDESLWVKIAMYDPKDVGRAASLLLAGAVLGRFWQPHESHVPYLLQLKVDLNLQGMGWLTLRTAKFRTPLPETFSRNRPGWATPATIQLSEPLSPPAASASNAPIWTEASTPSEMVWGGLTAPSRQSTCDLEVDGRVEDVTNRAALVRVPLQEASESTRMVESLAPMWEEEERRCGGAIPSPPPELPRTPQQLGHAAELLRAQFKEAEGAQLAAMQSGVEPGKSLSPEAGGQQEGPEVGSRGSGPTSSSVRVRSPLLAHTQAANDATLASELFFGAGGAAAKAGSGPVVENYDTFVDEAIVQTQLTMQPQPAEAVSPI